MTVNVGTRINAILKSQHFDYSDFGRVKLISTSVGLQMGVYAYTSDFEWVHIDENNDGTYNISKGLGKNEILASGVVEENLASALKNAINIKV